MEGFDQDLGRLYYRTYILPGGMNSSIPKVDVPPEASTQMMGCLSSLGHVIPAFSAAIEKWTGQLTETPRHMFVYSGYVETLVILCDTKAYVVALDILADKTPTTPFTSSTYSLWRGQNLLHQNVPVAVINNFGLDKPHYYDGGSAGFIPITSAPQAKAFCGWIGRLLVANVYVSGSWYVNRLQWSEINNITSWPLTGSSGFYDMDNDSDAILRVELTIGNYLIILRRKSVYLGIPNSLYTNPLSTQFLSSYGIRAPNSVQKEGSNLYYMGDSDIYKIAGVDAPVSVGAPIRTELFKLASAALISYAWSFLDILNNLYYLVVPLTDGTWRAWIYNYEQQSWSMQDLTGISCIGEWFA